MREQRQIPEPGDAAVHEKGSNPLHLIRRKAISFANLKTSVPGLPFGQDSFLRSHRFSFLRMFKPLPLIVKCEREMASSRGNSVAPALEEGAGRARDRPQLRIGPLPRCLQTLVIPLTGEDRKIPALADSDAEAAQHP